MKTNSQDFLVARPICSAISSNFLRPRRDRAKPFYANIATASLARRLFGFRFGNFCCVINSSRTEGETPKEGRKESGALRRKRVIICRLPAAVVAAAAAGAARTPVLGSFAPRFSGRGRTDFPTW